MNRKLVILLVGCLLTAVIAGLWLRPPASALAAEWEAKVDPWVLTTANGKATEFLVFLGEQADLSAAYALTNKADKGAYVYDALIATAARTQRPVINALEALGLQYQTYWIANMIWVRGDLAAVQALAQRPDVAHIYANPAVRADLPALPAAAEDIAPNTIEWGVQKVHAPDVWALGYTGQNVVVGGQDTGYDWDHPALKNQYRGWNGGAANHNYNWHDAIHSGGGICGPDSQVPCDDHGHGTHTMGTMVGDDGGSNQIGVAPGARWIGCRNMNQGVGTPATYGECYQWFIAPTDLNNQNPDPSKAPDVINNSWGCPPSEGCTDPNVLLTVVNNVHAAGIVTVHSAGNSGSSCSTVNEPAAIYEASFSVGATDSSDNIASFSSRGPVTVDGSNRLKPNVSAPGVNVRSSLPGTGYGNLSGTSMAGPHTVGVIALIFSAAPDLIGNPDAVETLFEQTAVPRTTTQTCGGIPGDQIPNNTYGFGRVDALNAYNGLGGGTPTLHIGDLDGGTRNARARWFAGAIATAHNETEGTLSGVAISFNVTGFGARSCTTDATGQCRVVVLASDSVPNVTFTVTGAVKSGFDYDASANHDPDGDSNGTTIVVTQP